MAETKDKQLRLIIGVILVLMGLPGIGFVRGFMGSMMMSGYGMMGYGGMSSSVLGIVFLVAGIWLIIDASKK